uniref:SAM domain-containing protein n=1 Tax=Angiostrongylus costaricensis TaxID=334426 RepID=A0A0R3Q1M2_ANGCS
LFINILYTLYTSLQSRKDAEVSTWDDDKYSSSCGSPVPRISEPASPALPHRFVHRRLLFPLKKKYATNENEFWRASCEQIQGLQVLHWTIDDVCQLLVSMGLDKYVPEFTINKITGAKFLDLDGTKLKTMGIQNHSDRSLIKKKVKMIKNRIERERKVLEKQSRSRVIASQGMHMQM